MEINEFTGDVILVKAMETYDKTKSGYPFHKRDVIVMSTETTVKGVFTNTLCFQATKDNIAKLDNIKIGDKVLVKYNVKGSIWEKAPGVTKYFPNLNLWDIQVLQSKGEINNNQTANAPDDLPF